MDKKRGRIPPQTTKTGPAFQISAMYLCIAENFMSNGFNQMMRYSWGKRMIMHI